MPSITINPGNSDAISRLVDQMQLSDDSRQALMAAKIERIRVHPGERSWHVFYTSEVDIDTLTLKALEDHFKSSIPELNRVYFKTTRSSLLEEKVSSERLDRINLRTAARSSASVTNVPEMPHSTSAPLNLNNKSQSNEKKADSSQPSKDFLRQSASDIEAKPKVAKKPIKQGPKVLMGRPFNAKKTFISRLREGDKGVVVAGKVFGLEIKTMGRNKSKKMMVFALTDRRDSINAKLFEGRGIKFPEMKNSDYVRMQGNIKADKMTGELYFSPVNICTTEPWLRKDRSNPKRVELHAHTKMSAMDAVVSAKDIVKLASSFGHSSIAITDHGVVQSFPDFYKAAKSENMKPIFGMEGYLVDTAPEDHDKARSWHILILAKNQTGLTNLYKLVSYSHLHCFYKKPRIPRVILEQHREGLIIGTACEAGELYQAMIHGADDDELTKISSFYDFIELQPVGNNNFLIDDKSYPEINCAEDLKALNRRLFDIGKAMKKMVVATGDVHFLDPEDALYRAILMAGQKYSDADKQAPLYLKTTDEMLEEFSYLGDEAARDIVVNNPSIIADSVEMLQPIPGGFYPPVIEGAEEAVRNTAYGRAKELYGDPLPELVEERLKKELKAIIGNGFAVLYYISMKIVNFSVDHGYLVGSRGSVGSSFAATMCGITEVNPLPPHHYCGECHHFEVIEDIGCGVDLKEKFCPRCSKPMKRSGFNIPFETFMGFTGEKVPDIDLNFSGNIQSSVHRYVEEYFGRENAFKAGTISTIQGKTVMGFVKGYFEGRQRECKRAELNRLVDACTGIKRTTGQHPGGIILVPQGKDINEFTPVQRPANDRKSNVVTTHFDYHVMDEQLVKLDILGHDDPTILRMLTDLTGIDVRDVPMDDAATMKLFHDARTAGIPEFGTEFVREMVRATKPSCFADLLRISGLSHGTDVWIGNAKDLIKRGIPLAKVISIRDDIMNDLIGFGLPPDKSFKIMEKVRKGKGLDEEQEALMRNNKVPGWYIDSCKKIKYMFPKAHAVAYVTSAWRIAWFKVHRPIAFFATYFSVRRPDFDCNLLLEGPEAIKDKMEYIKDRVDRDKKHRGSVPGLTDKEKGLLPDLELALETYNAGFKFLPVSIIKSSAAKFDVEDDGLRCPFSSMPGVGPSAADSIISVRDDGFTSIESLKSRAGVSQAVIEAFRSQGCLEGIPEQDQLSLF